MAAVQEVAPGESGLWAGVPEPWRSSRFLLSDRVRWQLEDVAVAPEAVLLTVRREGPSLIGIGAPDAVARLVDARAASGATTDWLTVPRASVLPDGTLDRLGLRRVSEWDWMSTDSQPPPQSLEHEVQRLDPVADAAAIRACLAVANPRSSADPAQDLTAGWWGFRSGDRLVGVVGASWRGGGGAVGAGGRSWHLHGLAVLSEQRGRGLGAALTAAAARAGLGGALGGTDGSPVSAVDPPAEWVSLALYADNHGARRIYQRLGFELEHENASYRPPTA